MEIKQTEITIRELTEGFSDNAEDGVVAYGGKLDVRPPYQREFVYKEKQRDAVIDSIVQNFPLNVMYWADRGDGTFEVIDGQQRTISICQYVNGDFAHLMRFFNNLQDDEQEQILNYKLNVYICSGTNSEKLKWFERINIAGEKLTPQELRNAVYCGSWVSDAKKYFSKIGCPAVSIGGDYVSGTANRQEILETAIDWISNGQIDEYMGIHQHDENASALWFYFQKVIAWVKAVFPTKRPKYTKGINWGELYNKYKDAEFDTIKLEEEIKKLILDDDVTKKSGIYPYVLTRNEKYLSIRTFSDNEKLQAYTKQNGICKICGKHFELEEMEADHITPWSQGGKTNLENCQMLCRNCNRRKSDK